MYSIVIALNISLILFTGFHLSKSYFALPLVSLYLTAAAGGFCLPFHHNNLIPINEKPFPCPLPSPIITLTYLEYFTDIEWQVLCLCMRFRFAIEIPWRLFSATSKSE